MKWTTLAQRKRNGYTVKEQESAQWGKRPTFPRTVIVPTDPKYNPKDNAKAPLSPL